MKPFAERNPFAVGLVGIALTAGVTGAALNYDRIPLIHSSNSYSAYFAEAGGLRSGAPVQVAGFRVGQVSEVSLDDTSVLVMFDVDRDVRLGELTEASVRTKSLLGSKVLEITPRGAGHLDKSIPLTRTRSPYELPDALGDLSATVNGLDTESLSGALSTLSDTFKDTPPALRDAVAGVARFSETLGERDAQLRSLLSNAGKATTVLSERADQITALVTNSNALLAELQSQSSALEQISGNVSALARQLSGFIGDNRNQLRPALEKLNGVMALIDDRKDELTLAIKYLNQSSMAIGESVASAPFFKGHLAALPGQLLQPFFDAAFADLGLDVNTLTPAEAGDPPTGQVATPALPIPYPRTGQGGKPRMTVPDAITGNPGDQQCGPPGLPLPGPGCYPYREPVPAPPAGGPPPGPPGAAVAGEPTPQPNSATAIGEQ